jgi:hypothetical protein
MFSLTKAKLRDSLQVCILFFRLKLHSNRLLKQSKGAVHLALDIWTDINMTAWLGIVLYVVQDDGYKKIPLDFIQCVLPLGIQTLALT